MTASLLPADLATLLFIVGIVVLVVSTLVMVIEMLHRRRPDRAPAPWGHAGRGGRTARQPVPYRGVVLSPDAAQVLSVAQQRAGAKQASLDIGVIGLVPGPVTQARPGASVLDVVPSLAAIGTDAQLTLPPVGRGERPAAPDAAEIGSPAAAGAVIRQLAPGEPLTVEMVLEVLQELAARDPERLVDIINAWMRLDRGRRNNEDGL